MYKSMLFAHASFFNEFDTFNRNMENWKNDIKLKWVESKKFPRKKKKRVRKELTLDWSIANHNIFDF